MRLIDADAMLERNKNSIYDTTDLEEMLKYEPTAYDVEKVIDELKNEFERHDRDRVYWQDHSWRDDVIYNGEDLNEEQADAFKKAIEIVKGGGKNE